ncbi:MAG: hypothetical protein P4L87_21075, partial [Formivibrio sp.]|nr:hypothetical protein [Formivibrio sp.]
MELDDNRNIHQKDDQSCTQHWHRLNTTTRRRTSDGGDGNGAYPTHALRVSEGQSIDDVDKSQHQTQ